MKHTVSQNGEFIAKYCKTNDNDIYMLLLQCLHPFLPSLIAVSKFMTDEIIQFNENSTGD